MSHPASRLRPWIGRALAAALLLGAGAASAQTHLDNPFVGATPYVNPDYTAQAEASAAAATDPALAAAMRQVGATPTAVWLDTIAQVGTMATHLDRALAAGQDLAVFVLDDIPGRGCYGWEISEFELTSDSLARYRSQFIDAVAAVARQPRYAGMRIVFLVEPKALASLVTQQTAPCIAGDASMIYRQAVQYAVNTLHAIPNAYVYLDLAHAAWMGWDQNATQFVALLGQVSLGFTAGKGAVDGFATNVGEYVPTQEPYLTAHQAVGGKQVWTSRFYDYNPMLDDATYAADMYARLVTAGWPATIGFVSDTSRNGWGGPVRPSGPSLQAIDLEAFVRESKVDGRADRGLWCNPDGAGIGQRPQAAPADFPEAHYHAYLWVKSPGQSDGASVETGNLEGKAFDRMCDPTYTLPSGVVTHALPGAPLSGKWFPARFTQLVQNAWPPIAAPSTATLSVTRSGLGTGFVTSSSGGIRCGSACSATLASGAVVTLTATAASGSVFAGWGGDCSGTSAVCVLSMTGDRTAVATFGGPTPLLTVIRAGTGSGTVTSTPTGISCGATCSGRFGPSTVVTLTAAPSAGSKFTGWTGACSGTSTTCKVTMPGDANAAATATFDLAPATPCANAITFSYNTGNLGTTGAACYRTAQRVNGWGCANFQGRTIAVDGGTPTTTCGAGPFPLPKLADGYTYFSVGAGTYPWASIYLW